MSRSRPCLAAFAALLLLGCDSQPTPAADPSLIGRWCYKPGNTPKFWQIIEIRRVQTGYQLQLLHNDGSRGSYGLMRTGSFYVEVDSDFGDKYEIDTATGMLNVADNEGVFGSADKLGNVPQPEDCQS